MKKTDITERMLQALLQGKEPFVITFRKAELANMRRFLALGKPGSVSLDPENAMMELEVGFGYGERRDGTMGPIVVTPTRRFDEGHFIERMLQAIESIDVAS